MAGYSLLNNPNCPRYPGSTFSSALTVCSFPMSSHKLASVHSQFCIWMLAFFKVDFSFEESCRSGSAFFCRDGTGSLTCLWSSGNTSSLQEQTHSQDSDVVQQAGSNPSNLSYRSLSLCRQSPSPCPAGTSDRLTLLCSAWENLLNSLSSGTQHLSLSYSATVTSGGWEET